MNRTQREPTSVIYRILWLSSFEVYLSSTSKTDQGLKRSPQLHHHNLAGNCRRTTWYRYGMRLVQLHPISMSINNDSRLATWRQLAISRWTYACCRLVFVLCLYDRSTCCRDAVIKRGKGKIRAWNVGHDHATRPLLRSFTLSSLVPRPSRLVLLAVQKVG